ncbi:ubiquitin conjugation factor E4 [Colletotrichum spaethianum]|uniref:Ubiquitin conjugation factor E4 n=1 Tax=Colletotrichum spaethianum TaxID=700344 RepID=A0AA37UR70_9PEZI|nr:ubiquitin conjugation factor E4 [Colletotrichum spaethianum]GKT50252.1 ubiquitin conjugation factor E4 [Colletotrichum spaethianum]
MVSYIIGANAHGKDAFRGRLPTIFEIQEFIESAWDLGINSQGRLETGGIKGTRKYIGTPEARQLLAHEPEDLLTCVVYRPKHSLCVAQGFKDPEPGKSEAKLMMAVEQYFRQGTHGHSLTIVGFERQKHGPANLLVFDPMFRDPPALSRLIGQTFKHRSADESLKPYRRGAKYLRRYREFELLRYAIRTMN